jgi:hypothetical protein
VPGGETLVAMMNIRKILLTIALGLTGASFSQIGDLRIYNSDDYKCYLHQLNDSLVYMTFEEYPDPSTYYLGKFYFNNDSLIIDEIIDPISIKKDVYYWGSQEIDSDKIIIEYFNNDFIIPNGHFTFDSLRFEINGQNYPMTEQGLVDDSYSIEINRPKSKSIKIKVLSNSELVCEVSAELSSKKNHILIKESSVVSLPGYTTETFEELIPEQIVLDGKNYHLFINLAE